MSTNNTCVIGCNYNNRSIYRSEDGYGGYGSFKVEFTNNDDLDVLAPGDAIEVVTSSVPAPSSVFNAINFSGNASSQTVVSNINNTGKSLTWFKCHNASFNHNLFDTVRGPYDRISSNEINYTDNDLSGVQGWTSNGVEVGDGPAVNNSGPNNMRLWNFRAAPGFMDIVKWDGDGSSNRLIPHDLQDEIGFVMIKSLTNDHWAVLHHELPAGSDPYYTQLLYLNLDRNSNNAEKYFQHPINKNPGNISLGNSSYNGNSTSYIAYVFPKKNNNVACGEYIGTNGSGPRVIDCGLRPAWVMLKRATGNGNWIIRDNVNTGEQLFANSSGPATSNSDVTFTSTGFEITGTAADYNKGSMYVYIAIRDGADGEGIKAMATVESIDVANDSISISDRSGDWLNIAGEKVIGEAVIGTGVFDSSTNNVATITGSNKRWIDSNNTQNIDIKMISPEGGTNLTDEEFNALQASMLSSTHRQDIVNALAASGFTLDDVFSYSEDEE